jgi:hypothetical protein
LKSALGAPYSTEPPQHRKMTSRLYRIHEFHWRKVYEKQAVDGNEKERNGLGQVMGSFFVLYFFFSFASLSLYMGAAGAAADADELWGRAF